MITEKNLETAIIAVIDDETELDVRHWTDGTESATYPALLVQVVAFEPDPTDPTGANGVYRCSVNIIAMTYNADDRNKSAVSTMIETARAEFRDSGFAEAVEDELTDVSIYAILPGAVQQQFDENNTNIISQSYDFRMQL